MRLPAAACAIAALFVTCCSARAVPDQTVPAVRTFVSILPQRAFVQRIGGERVSVDVLVQPGQSPATYDPTPRQMAALGRAGLFFRIGVPFENGLLPRIRGSMPDLKIVDTREGVPLRVMEAHGHDGHDHAHEHTQEHGAEHAQEGRDPHIWLSPKLVMVQAHTICGALSEHDPEGKALYEANLRAFLIELDELDSRVAAILEPVKGGTMLVFHPSWGYFADAYGLEQWAIEVEGKTPGARQLAEIMDRAEEQGVKAIFVQPQFSRRAAEVVANAIRADVKAIDPLAEDYMVNLEAVARAVREALSP